MLSAQKQKAYWWLLGAIMAEGRWEDGEREEISQRNMFQSSIVQDSVIVQGVTNKNLHLKIYESRC